MLLYLQGIFLCKKCTKNLDVSKNISTFALAKSERGVAQSGSAPGLGPGGRRFESCRPDTKEALLMKSLFCVCTLGKFFACHNYCNTY